MSDINKGTGRLAPHDVPEFIEITLTVENGEITNAEFSCTDDAYMTDCAKAVCGVVLEKPVADIMQMNGNAVIWNTECDLPRDKLYLASMAVMATKRAAADWAGKNGIGLPGDDSCHCS